MSPKAACFRWACELRARDVDEKGRRLGLTPRFARRSAILRRLAHSHLASFSVDELRYFLAPMQARPTEDCISNRLVWVVIDKKLNCYVNLRIRARPSYESRILWLLSAVTDLSDDDTMIPRECLTSETSQHQFKAIAGDYPSNSVNVFTFPPTTT